MAHIAYVSDKLVSLIKILKNNKGDTSIALHQGSYSVLMHKRIHF